MARKSQPLVSVVIPTRNRMDLLMKAINSAIDQTWKNIEIIVVNDASTDTTETELQALDLLVPLKIISNKFPSGGSKARNQGVDHAAGHYIAFLDDDDTWYPTKLERQIFLFEANAGCSAVTCCYTEEIPGEKTTFVKVDEVSDVQELLFRNQLGGASMYLTTKANFFKCGGFDNNLKSGQDWDLILKLWLNGHIIVAPEPLVNYLSHGQTRITNLDNTYKGLVYIYLKYRDLMSANTRKKQLAELTFLRLKMARKGSPARTLKLWKLACSLQFKDSLFFFLRYIKFYTRK